MEEGFKVDKNLPNKLDNLLKEGNLNKETEISKILETLSEKLKTQKQPTIQEFKEDRNKSPSRLTMHKQPDNSWG